MPEIKEGETRRRSGSYEISPTSKYFLYGKGSDEEYNREIRRIKTELRERAYGERYDYEAEAQKNRKKRPNAAAIILFVLSALTVLIMALGRLSGLDGWLRMTETADGITLIKGFVSCVTGSVFDMTFGFGLCACIVALTSVVMMIYGVAKARGAYIGGFARLIACLQFATLIALLALALVDGDTVPGGLMILLIMSFAALITAAAGRKRTEVK